MHFLKENYKNWQKMSIFFVQYRWLEIFYMEKKSDSFWKNFNFSYKFFTFCISLDRNVWIFEQYFHLRKFLNSHDPYLVQKLKNAKLSQPNRLFTLLLLKDLNTWQLITHAISVANFASSQNFYGSRFHRIKTASDENFDTSLLSSLRIFGYFFFQHPLMS